MEELYEFFIMAIKEEVSDIHLKPGQQPVIRREGRLIKTDYPKVTEHMLMEIINEILSAQLKEEFERKAEIDFAWNFNDVARFRANLFTSGGQPCLALRYVKDQVLKFEDLHLPASLATIAESRSGIVLLAGTTGSGKSTTLASMIQYINDRSFRRIITVEDPVEYLFKDNLSIISQREVGFDTPSFKSGLKNAMRQDPDIIMVGEIRDRDSVETAFAAAETGHLIFSTIHTENSSQSILRILDMFESGERQQVLNALSNTVRAVISQRLIPDNYGRVRPACEILTNSPVVQKLIAEEDVDKLAMAIETGGEDGMQSFNQALFAMVQGGHISQEVALAHSSHPDALRMNFKGIFLDTSKRILGR